MEPVAKMRRGSEPPSPTIVLSVSSEETTTKSEETEEKTTTTTTGTEEEISRMRRTRSGGGLENNSRSLSNSAETQKRKSPFFEDTSVTENSTEHIDKIGEKSHGIEDEKEETTGTTTESDELRSQWEIDSKKYSEEEKRSNSDDRPHEIVVIRGSRERKEKPSLPLLAISPPPSPLSPSSPSSPPASTASSPLASPTYHHSKPEWMLRGRASKSNTPPPPPLPSKDVWEVAAEELFSSNKRHTEG